MLHESKEFIINTSITNMLQVYNAKSRNIYEYWFLHTGSLFVTLGDIKGQHQESRLPQGNILSVKLKSENLHENTLLYMSSSF